MPSKTRARYNVVQWLMFQMAGVGLMFGQRGHFVRAAPEKIPYAIERYTNESRRLLNVIENRLAESAYLAGDYSIADMAAYPWTVPWERQGQKLDDYANLKRWWETMRDRPAVKRAYEVGKAYQPNRQNTDPEVRKILFGQSADTVRRPA